MDAAFHRLRGDQVGSLVNSPELLDVFRAFEAVFLYDERLRAIQTHSIATTLKSSGKNRVFNFYRRRSGNGTFLKEALAVVREDRLSRCGKGQ